MSYSRRVFNVLGRKLLGLLVNWVFTVICLGGVSTEFTA